MSEEKTELPTQKKLNDSREKGDVEKSEDLKNACHFVVFTICLWILGESLIRDIIELINLSAVASTMPFNYSLFLMMERIANFLTGSLLPIIAAMGLIALVGGFLHVGPLLSFEPLNPSLDKLNPLNTIKNWFSLKSIAEFIKHIVRTVMIVILVSIILAGFSSDLLWAPSAGMKASVGLVASILMKLLSWATSLFVVIAVFDLFLAKMIYIKQHRMSKDEVKREHKESEGDPLIKAQFNQIRHEIISGN